MKCPRCNKDMEKLKKENIIIDVCKKCKGIWLDEGEIEKLAKIANKMRGGKNSKK
ncbi:MAG: zf-TFIIB domain-containing protein [Nanoarchaeota archaeon]|nr:zf-TFIIB domain-containing protein [Nanoarchaeota archaeon]MBU1004833.1 zf-TFIIB domain-containing protein [Nanoarchaeota archaeon]MBU1946771.1 zf-TFIIB domain-containing protein [Nanoarchaeota archaeon]